MREFLQWPGLQGKARDCVCSSYWKEAAPLSKPQIASGVYGLGLTKLHK